MRNSVKIPPTKAEAYHEAAHAVVSVILGMRFECIRLCHEDVTRPHGGKAVRRGRIEVDATEVVYRDGAFREACMHMAGLCANKRMYPKMSYGALILMFGAGDVQEVAKWVDYLCFGDERAAAKMERKVTAETRKLVGQHWESIVKVGNELLARERLSYDEVKSIAAIPGQ